jgi:hypothetical protein
VSDPLKAVPGKREVLIALLKKSAVMLVRTLKRWRTTRLIAAEERTTAETVCGYSRA